MSKLIYEDKVRLYEKRKQEIKISGLCSKYKVNHSVIEYIIRLMDKHD